MRLQVRSLTTLKRKSENTLDAQRADLATFADYLCAVTVCADCPTADHAADRAGSMARRNPWACGGLCAVDAAAWLLIASCNRKLSTVRVYAKLAAQAKVIDATEATLIRGVAGYGGKEGKRQDEQRKEAGQATRNGHKKAQHVSLTPDQVKALKTQPDTPQGRRDAVIMALLLDHGLRVGELALLEVTAFNLKAAAFTFYRPKVDKVQTHRMTHDTVRAIAAWLLSDAPAMGPLLRGSRKGGHLTAPGMSERAITSAG